MKTKQFTSRLADGLWDLWCLLSLIGIWPRFIEPNLLVTKRLSLPIKNLSKEIKIFSFSDLHIHPKMPQWHLDRLIKKVKEEQPDLIFFTGDFICNATLDDEKRLLAFLNAFPHARYGNFTIPGNHDYASFLGISQEGEYDVITEKKGSSLIGKGFRRLFFPPPIKGKVTAEAKLTPLHQGLKKLLESTPFRLLDNETVRIPLADSSLNICGLGEYTGGQTLPSRAFEEYDRSAPGIILLHNPDGIPLLNDFPGELILCGHTHGGQINLPWICQRLALMEHPHYKRGLIKEKNRWIYISRGVGAVMRFRWFSLPEILILTLKNEET